MNKIYDVRSVKIGAGKPKIIVPIVGKTQTEILDKAAQMDLSGIDFIEWRVDFYEDVFDFDKVEAVAASMRGLLGETPIIFTFRTLKEGGEKAIDMEAYTELNRIVAASGYVDIIDVELFSGDDIVKNNVQNIHSAGKLVIMSNHDFHKTPSEDELIFRMKKMIELEGDIPKIAVMPNSMEDVLTLLSATLKMYKQYADRPIVTMSMSSMGVISRLAGSAFGSAMTFGAVGQVSAPGQIPVEQLNQVLEILLKAM
ncbi:type I 3-dehydroquinate dehydratase [Fusibacter ferrireducens]|uniref:3-dehydroquinate dehydratase n=1 Tax=Fusibacter ferrireducens TaxID=2785058 RepID=A0ABR9ZV26_9FIRM|nr:type I 3-dehydroquinate dehydratase [Fusibacter ferrireducens]MBF4694283.1 type I 3-dehydroquinate dehydratase [Fusibacter ferrireducens]